MPTPRPTRALEPTEHEKRLAPHLLVQKPSTLEDAAPVLSFERDRDLDIPWDKVFAHIETHTSSMAPVREYFERSWNVTVDAEHFDAEFLQKQVTELPGETLTSVQVARFATDYKKDAAGKETAVPESIRVSTETLATGLVIHDGYGRRYACTARPDQSIGAADFKNYEDYERFWEQKLRGYELCFLTAEDAEHGHTRVEYVDLAEKAILDAYDDLKAQEAFDKDLQGKIAEKTPEMISALLATGLDIERIDGLERSLTTIRIRELNIRRRFGRLVQRAAELGYLLFLEDVKDRTFPDGSKAPVVKAGSLYRQYRFEYRWTTTVERVECPARRGLRAVTSFLGIESPEPKRWKENQAHAATILDYKLVNVNDNVITDKLAGLSKQYSVYAFSQTAQGFRTADGATLRQIMLRCDRDEAFRRQCAIVIPKVEVALSGRKAIAGYNIFLAPLPGVLPTAFPRLSVHESLTYRMAWQETRLGEVVNSINLAPGETRTITVRRSYEEETTVTQKRTTIFDLQESKATDIETQLEKQIEHENDAGWDLKLASSAGGSGTIDGIGVKASSSRSFGYHQSIRSFTKSLTRSAKRASQTVNRNYKDEVTTDTRRTTRVSNYDEYTSTITNINQGRTLNLLFYRLSNRYEAALFLDGLEFKVTPSVEIIAGSGIHDTQTYEVTDFDGLLEDFAAGKLPFALDEAGSYQYWTTVTKHLQDTLDAEYGPTGSDLMTLGTGVGAPSAILQLPPRDDKQRAEIDKLEEEVEKLRAEQKAEAKAKAAAAKKKDEQILDLTREAFEGSRRLVIERLRGTEVLGRRIGDAQTLEILAPGLYVDSLVGAMPSTEAYSERMREQVIAQKIAETALTHADAQYRLSLAGRVTENAGNWIVGVMPYPDVGQLALGLKGPLAAGEWEVWIDGDAIGTVAANQIGHYMVSVNVKDGAMLGDAGLMQRRVELRNRKEGVTIAQFVAPTAP